MTIFELNESLPIKKSVQSIQSFLAFIQEHKMEVQLTFIDGRENIYDCNSCIITRSSVGTNIDYLCSIYNQYEFMITLVGTKTGKEKTIRFDGNALESSTAFGDGSVVIKTYIRYNAYTGRERDDTCPSVLRIVLKKSDMELVKNSIVYKIHAMEIEIHRALQDIINSKSVVEIEAWDNIEWKRLIPDRIIDYYVLINKKILQDKNIYVVIKSAYFMDNDEKMRMDEIVIPIDLNNSQSGCVGYPLVAITKNTGICIKEIGR